MSKASPIGIAPFDAAEHLKDEERIAEFLNASFEMSDPAVLLNALSTVARARSMSQLAEASGLGRESLYKALKPGAQPRYETVMKVLSALGVQMVFRAPPKRARTPHAPVKVRAPLVTKPEPAKAAKTSHAKKVSPRTGSAEIRATANGKSHDSPNNSRR